MISKDNNWTIFYPKFEQNLINEINEFGILKSFKEGEYITKYGQIVNNTILIISGMIKVFREDEEGNEFLMYYITAGNACAISILCTSNESTSQITAKSIEDSEVILIPLSKTEFWLSKYRTWMDFVVNTYRIRFEDVLTTLDSVAFKNLDQRLLFYLKRHKINEGKEILLSHQKIAEELNTSREVISRLLKKMEKHGHIVLNRNKIEIINLPN